MCFSLFCTVSLILWRRVSVGIAVAGSFGQPLIISSPENITVGSVLAGILMNVIKAADKWTDALKLNYTLKYFLKGAHVVFTQISITLATSVLVVRREEKIILEYLGLFTERFATSSLNLLFMFLINQLFILSLKLQTFVRTTNSMTQFDICKYLQSKT